MYSAQLMLSSPVQANGNYCPLVAQIYIKFNHPASHKKIFEGKLEGRRGRGWPRLRWINNVDVKQWRMKALDRVEWASIIREVKAKLKGL
jgi:hypothetical protein